jgi:hypothetical protein
MFKSLRRFAVLLSGLAIIAGATALNLPAASASSGSHLCESFALQYCVGGGSLNAGQPVSETSGRNMIFSTSNGSVGTLQFTGGTNVCADENTSDHLTVIMGGCSGTGVLWTETVTNGHLRFSNNDASRFEGVTVFLSGCGCGGQYEIQIAGTGNEAFNFQ